MKKMKTFWVVLLTLCMITSLVACSKGKEEANSDTKTGTETGTESGTEAGTDTGAETNTGTETTSELPEGPVEIELWTDMTIDETILTDAIAKFEEAYADKGYQVVLNKFAGSERATLVSAAIESDTLPALFLSAWFTTADYVHQGLIADISDVATPVQEKIYASTYWATLINNKSYMIGLYQSYFGLLYNADLFREAGLDKYISADKLDITTWTLDELEEILAALSKHFEGTEKYPMPLFAASAQADTYMLNWLTMYGGNMWKDGYSAAGSDENTIAALDRMIYWSQQGWTNSNVITKDGTEVSPDFSNQMSAICLGQYTNYKNNLADMKSGKIKEFDLRIAAVPQKIDGEDAYTMANYIYGASVMNNGKEDEMAVAKEFLRWLLQDQESLTAFNTNAIPCFTEITEATSEENPLYLKYAEFEPYIWDFTGGVAGYVSTRSCLFPELQAAFSEEKTSAEALKNYSDNANEIIKDYMENSLVLK
jgi:multiple sugar transport system substrate-binding protein